MRMHVAVGLALIFGAALLVPPLPAAAELQVHTQDSVSYVSGGVGDEERRAIEAMSARFNLKLTTVLANGEYVNDVNVRIQDSSGHAVVEAVTDGPFFFAHLPPGSYTVSCSLNGKELKQTAQVTGAKQQQLMCRWSSE